MILIETKSTVLINLYEVETKTIFSYFCFKEIFKGWKYNRPCKRSIK